jgi:DNA polymerase III gamma/tau subunit
MPHTFSLHHVTQEEVIEALSTILKIDKEKLLSNTDLFSNMSPYVKNVMHYLAQMKDEQMLISASHSMELVLNFNKSPIGL